MRKADNKEKSLSDMKQKLENNILVTEKHLAELRMATDKKLEIEMGKTRRLGLEVLSITNAMSFSNIDILIIPGYVLTVLCSQSLPAPS